MLYSTMALGPLYTLLPINIVACKWLFHLKRKGNGSIDHYKGLLIAKGWPIHRIDAHNAFLHGWLFEDVCMAQLHDFIYPLFRHHVCKLYKALYGLKQTHLEEFLEDLYDPGRKKIQSVFTKLECGPVWS